MARQGIYSLIKWSITGSFIQWLLDLRLAFSIELNMSTRLSTTLISDTVAIVYSRPINKSSSFL